MCKSNAAAPGCSTPQQCRVEWVLGLSSWIIQDGNYGDITTGDRLDAAVEFGFQDAFALTEATSPSASHEAGSVYEWLGPSCW